MGAFLSPLQIADVIESDQSAFERQSDVIRLVQRELIDVRATLRAQKQTMTSMQVVINDIDRDSNRCDVIRLHSPNRDHSRFRFRFQIEPSQRHFARVSG